jgi:hypothetical protein
MPMPDTDAVALDAYSQVVTCIAAELTPRVAAVNGKGRWDGKRRGDDLTLDGQGEDQADTDEDLRLIRRGRPVPPLDRP